MDAFSLPELTYAKRRRRLGICYVGTYVLLAAVALLSGWAPKAFGTSDPSFIHWFRNLLCFTAAYEFIGIPFDLIGISIDKQYRRTTRSLVSCLIGLLKSICKHAILFMAFAFLITTASRVGGLLAIAVGSTFTCLFYMWKQAEIARFLSDIYFVEPNPTIRARFTRDRASKAQLIMACTEESGFTGGTIGLRGSTSIVVPERWLDTMSDDEFWTAIKRRDLTIVSGSRSRGISFSVLFTVIGILVAAIVTTSIFGLSIDATAGLATFCFVFTLWSFIGLLTLPSVNQRAVMQADYDVVQSGVADELLASTVRGIDSYMESEDIRSDAVQFIFHPIPNPARRLRGHDVSITGSAWHVARYSVSLSIIGLSLLSRAVHCNAGKPDLWSILPAD